MSTPEVEPPILVSSGKKVFGKKAKPLAAAASEGEPPTEAVGETSNSNASPPPTGIDEAVSEVQGSKNELVNKAASSRTVMEAPDDGEAALHVAARSPPVEAPTAVTAAETPEPVQEFKATKKFFGKKSSQTPPTSDKGPDIESASNTTQLKDDREGPSSAEPPKPSASATATITTTANDRDDDGDEQQVVKPTKKIFGKKAASVVAPTEESSPPSPTPVLTVQPQRIENSDQLHQDESHNRPDHDADPYQQDALQAPTKKVFTKKTFGQKQQEQEPQQDDGETKKKESSIAASTLPAATLPRPRSPTTNNNNNNNNNNSLLHKSSNKKLPGQVLQSSSATWDDWYEEVCRFLSGSVSVGVSSDKSNAAPTTEQIEAEWPSLVPSGRTLPWLLIERRFSSDQRVPLLWRAAAAGWGGVVEAVLDAAAKEDDASGSLVARVLLDAGSEDGTSSLYVAAQNGQAAICERILRAARAAPSGSLYQQVLNQRRRTGATPLFIAVQARHNSVVHLLLKAGADKEISNVQQATPLVLACSMDSDDIVAVLLTSGANWRDRRTTKAALAWAGPKAREVLESFISRRLWFFRWINRVQQIKDKRNRPAPALLSSASSTLSKVENNINMNTRLDDRIDDRLVLGGISPIPSTKSNGNQQELDEKSAADARVAAILDAMLLSMQRKQMKAFLVNFNDERSFILEAERSARRDLSYQFAMNEPANLGLVLGPGSGSSSSSPRKITSTGGGLFSPELQPTPEALKAKQLPAWAVMNSSSSGSKSNSYSTKRNNNYGNGNDDDDDDVGRTLISRQRMLNVGCDVKSESEDHEMVAAAAASSKLHRPSIESLVKALKAEKEALAAGKTPTTRHGLPIAVVVGGGLGGGGSGGGSTSSPVPPFASPSHVGTKLTPLPTTPAAARYATGLDFSRRREFEWDARLHRIAPMDASPNPKLYRYDPASSSSSSSTTRSNNKKEVDWSERKPLHQPPKGIRKNDW